MQAKDFMRSAARPVISVIAMCVVAQVITQQIDIPPYQWALLDSVIVWWFVDRTVRRGKER